MTEQAPTYNKGSLYQIPCADLQADPNQPRKYFDDVALQDLVNSIKDKGVLQPILFRVDQDGKPVIVAGERRLQAAKQADLKTIPGILVEGYYEEIALVENLLREDLTAIELAEALDHIMKEHNYTQDQLTGIIGKAKSTVSKILSLNNLPEEIKNECEKDPKISRKTLIQIAKKKKPESMVKAFEKYKERSSRPPKTRGPKGKRKSWIERFASKYENLTTFVADMDLGILDTPSRKDLISQIEKLKKTADSLIAQIQKAPAKEIKPKEAPKPKKMTKEKKKPIAKASSKKEKKPAPKKEVKKISSGAKPKTKNDG